LIFGLTIRTRLGATPTGFIFFEKCHAHCNLLAALFVYSPKFFVEEFEFFTPFPLLSSRYSAFRTMKKELLPKQLLFAAAIASLLAFISVNLHASCAKAQVVERAGLVQAKVEQTREQEQEMAEIKVPNLTVLGRVWEIAQRLLEKTN
jgi:hypothetical protein